MADAFASFSCSKSAWKETLASMTNTMLLMTNNPNANLTQEAV